jgi:hypothetical protein
MGEMLVEGQQGQSSASTDDQDVKSARQFCRRILLFTLAALVVREILAGRTVLLTELPIPIKWASYLVGLALGGILARKLITIAKSQDQIFKGAIVAVALIPLSVVTSSYLGRWIFEVAAFANSTVPKHDMEVRIMEILPKGRSWGYRAQAMAYPDSREIDIFVTGRLYDRLIAIRPPLWRRTYFQQEFCFTLPVERGRWRAVRADVPALWDDGLHDYHKCYRPTVY